MIWNRVAKPTLNHSAFLHSLQVCGSHSTGASDTQPYDSTYGNIPLVGSQAHNRWWHRLHWSPLSQFVLYQLCWVSQTVKLCGWQQPSMSCSTLETPTTFRMKFQLVEINAQRGIACVSVFATGRLHRLLKKMHQHRLLHSIMYFSCMSLRTFQLQRMPLRRTYLTGWWQLVYFYNITKRVLSMQSSYLYTSLQLYTWSVSCTHIVHYIGVHWWTWRTASHYNNGQVWSTGSPVARVPRCMLARPVGRWIIDWKSTGEHLQAGTWPSLQLQLMSRMSSIGRRPR